MAIVSVIGILPWEILTRKQKRKNEINIIRRYMIISFPREFWFGGENVCKEKIHKELSLAILRNDPK